MAEYIQEYKFDTAQEFLSALAPWSESPSLDGYIFRGHSNSNYLLAPTSIREESKESIWDCSLAYAEIGGVTKDNDYSLAFVEYQLIRDFYREADVRGLHVPISDRLRSRLHQKIDFLTMSTWSEDDEWLPHDMLEVAALAQHYGVPTRLLDWTYDPFVAAFFSSKPSRKSEGDLCVWGLNAKTIASIQTVGKSFPLKLVTPHYSGNPNLAAQSGLFSHWAHKVPGLNNIAKGDVRTLPPVDRRPLDVLISEYLDNNSSGSIGNLFVKLTLQNSQSLSLARLLRKSGYGPAKLFPGYEGVAMELKERPFLKRNRELM